MTQIKRTSIVVGLATIILAFQNCGKGFSAPKADVNLLAITENGMKQVGAKISSATHSFSGNQNFTQNLPTGAGWILIDWNCTSSSQSVSLGVEIQDSNNVVILAEPLCSLASSTVLQTIAGSTMMPIPANSKKVHFLSGFPSSGNNFPSVTATYFRSDIDNLALMGGVLGNLSYDSTTAVTPPVTPTLVPDGAKWLFVQSTCSGQSLSLAFKDENDVDLMDFMVCYPGTTTPANSSTIIPIPVGALTVEMTNTVIGVSVDPPQSVIAATSTFYGASTYPVSVPSIKEANFTYAFPTAGSDSVEISIPSGSTWVDAWAACQNDQPSPVRTLTATFKDRGGNSLFSFEACNFATASSFGAGYAPFQIPIPPGSFKLRFETGDPAGSSINVILSGYFWSTLP